jgi:hypothetical protein
MKRIARERKLTKKHDNQAVKDTAVKYRKQRLELSARLTKNWRDSGTYV